MSNIIITITTGDIEAHLALLRAELDPEDMPTTTQATEACNAKHWAEFLTTGLPQTAETFVEWAVLFHA
tara:strand:+ start:400 stop:606 length:207 start_codon:yes stop_codon:yes gene_type:complete